LENLIQTYTLYSRTEGHSPLSINIVVNSLRLFTRFLEESGRGISVDLAGPPDIRLFILHLGNTPAFSRHPITPVQPHALSGHTISTYLRSLRSFYSWMVAEGFMAQHPFAGVRVPKPPRKVIATFSPEQLARLFAAVDSTTPRGLRDLTLMLLLLDSGLRISEAIGLTTEGLSLEEGVLRVLGKGNKERQVPVGRTATRYLLRYLSRGRPQPAAPYIHNVFLTDEGYPMTKDRAGNIMHQYGRQAGITGVRCSPHTLRHSAAVAQEDYGGNLFALQKMLGHTSLDMTRRYCELADVDVKRAHLSASPVDNLVVPRMKKW
jgi:site-specific recombinase XerD